MDIRIEASWKEALKDEFEKPYFGALVTRLKQEKVDGKQIFPPGSLIFHAFDRTPLSKVRVVILGQDPYHGPGQAHGLSFSVPEGVKPPPSLVNIFKEIKSDLGQEHPSGCLEDWADQGVFLLNAMLTVRASEPGSHKDIGWQGFTDAVIRTISEQGSHVVFMLWGNFARSKKALIDPKKHLILEAAHPSPLSVRSFAGCRHFSLANQYFVKLGLPGIVWGTRNTPSQ